MISDNITDYELNMSLQYQNLNMYETDIESSDISQNETSSSHNDEKALRMMQKMGYKEGSGLGKSEQGNTKVVDFNYQLGKRGFGLKLRNIEDTMEKWDFALEDVNVKENFIWLDNEDAENFTLTVEEMSSWLKEGPPIVDIKTQSNYCDQEFLNKVVEAKDIFDEMDIIELCHARARSNPFESLRSAFFMNRAALKMANIDALTDFMFTNIDKNEHFTSNTGPFYFADVCAGPGGFSEYILWKKRWLFKGFGLTLKDENDFKLHESCCACPATFQSLYGKDEDGNVCSPENITDFTEKVLFETEGEGVHFMMSDGGFSVEGNENFQEILSKSIYICQCLVALEIVRSHGHFVTKLFDVFTSFSVGLLYLIYHCFEKVSILKPNSSRPANSERYFICSNLRRNTLHYENVKKYLWIIVQRLWALNGQSEIDILEIVPLEVLKKDENFYKFICNSNNSLAIKQTVGLKKLATFCRNPTLVESRQEELKKKCLEFWQIPDRQKTPLPQLSAIELVNTVMDKPEIILVQPREINQIKAFNELISNIEDWYYYPLFSSKKTNNCNFYAGVSVSKVYRLQKHKWVRIKNVQLSRGTLVYGEFVKEKCTTKSLQDQEIEYIQYSLHIIDALQLGEQNLSDLDFSERQEIIKVYCKSLNKESQPHLVRIRPKVMDKLIKISSNCLISQGKEGLYCNLPLMGYKSVTETFNVNSILLLKTNLNQSFHWSYVLRVQIFIKSVEDINEDTICLEDILIEIKQRS